MRSCQTGRLATAQLGRRNGDNDAYRSVSQRAPDRVYTYLMRVGRGSEFRIVSADVVNINSASHYKD